MQKLLIPIVFLFAAIPSLVAVYFWLKIKARKNTFEWPVMMLHEKRWPMKK